MTKQEMPVTLQGTGLILQVEQYVCLQTQGHKQDQSAHC